MKKENGFEFIISRLDRLEDSLIECFKEEREKNEKKFADLFKFKNRIIGFAAAVSIAGGATGASLQKSFVALVKDEDVKIKELIKPKGE